MTAQVLVWLGIAVMLVGAATAHGLLTVLGIMLITVSGLSWLWATHLLNNVAAAVQLERSLARYGDAVEGALVVENDQPFPVPWLECHTEWPADLPSLTSQLSSHYKANRMLLMHVLSLGWFERVIRRFRVRCLHRGEFVFGPTDLTAADPFGFFEGRSTTSSTSRLVIYPRISPVRFRTASPQSPFGDRRATSWIYDDPVRFRGAREYMPGDPFSRIEWKATARTGQLHTRVFDASLATEVGLVVNVSTKERAWEGIGRQWLERTLAVGASLLAHLSERGFRVGVYTNGFVRGQSGSAMVTMGAGDAHLRQCLKLLGRLMPVSGARFPVVLDRIAGRVSDHAQIMVITPMLSAEITRACLRHRSRGRTPVVFFTGPADDFRGGPIPAFKVQPEGGPEDLDEIILSPAGQ